MKPPPQREEALFQAAARLAGAERATFLNGDYHGDPALRQWLESRLTAPDAMNSDCGNLPLECRRSRRRVE